ncbi:MAG TPA: VOC family protein [Motiliproteus sp.]
MRIKGLDHLVLRVADTTRSAQFYHQLLGCPVERRVEEIGLVQLRAGSSLIDLVPAVDEVPQPGNLEHFCLVLDPFDPELIALRCQQLGVSCEAPERRYGASGYGPSIYVLDPDGNKLELKGPVTL